MPTGTPITLKCPKCKRGKWGYTREREGMMVVGVEVQPSRSNHSGHGGGGPSFFGHRSIVLCLDCGHQWATTLFTYARIDWIDCRRPGCSCKPVRARHNPIDEA